MSLLNDLARSALGAVSGHSNTNQQGNLMSLVTNLISNHTSGEGLAGLVKQLAEGGLGPQVNSWVSTGPNQSVTGNQLHEALGADTLNALAQKTGLPPNLVSDALAHLLPQVVDRLTPQGAVPQTAALQTALGGLMQTDWFRSMSGAR
jgi:uncharacterized protein YidB (DUF937 family)